MQQLFVVDRFRQERARTFGQASGSVDGRVVAGEHDYGNAGTTGNERPHGASLEEDAAALRRRLDAGLTDISRLGDPLLLARRFDEASEADVRALFGTRFTTALERLAPGTWHGPIQSGYGVHLVRLVQRDAGRAPMLAEAREDVRREWMHAQREAANARFYAALRKRYDVRISVPTPGGTSPRTVAELRP